MENSDARGRSFDRDALSAGIVVAGVGIGMAFSAAGVGAVIGAGIALVVRGLTKPRK
jgi:hypothetical protein